MLSSRWCKVLNDLLSNKTRTVLIVLSIAVGLFAVGTIISSQRILSTELARGFAEINPSSGTIRTLEPFDEDFIRSVRRMDVVAEVDARRTINARVKDSHGEWNNLLLFAIEDYEEMQVNKIRPQSGAWPPPEREILIERSSLGVLNSQVGDTLVVETPNGRERALPITGIVHDMAQLPSQFDGVPYGYISFDTLEWFGEPYGYNELHIVAANPEDSEYAQSVVNQVKRKAEKIGLTIPLSWTAEPGQFPLDDFLQAILLLMGTIGLLSLFLSVFLIINTVSALLAQQRRQIGVMKAIGARSDQLIGMYLGMVLIYGLIALFLSIPLSVAGSKALSRYLATLFNFDLVEATVPPIAILLQIAVGLLVPVLASLYPFIANLRVTAADAMSTVGLTGGRLSTGIVDRLLSGANLWFARRILRRPLLLSLRNTFRSKARLALTLITLSLSSAIFVAVFSVSASLDQTIDDLLQIYNLDSMITLSRPYRAAKIETEAQRIPGVVRTDTWLSLPVRRLRDDGSESAAIYLFAPRADSEMIPGPAIIEGRWLLPEDENAIVVDSVFLKEEPDVRLGDDLALKIDGREKNFRVVGIGMGVLIPMAYAPYPYIAHLTNNAGQADTALIGTDRHDEASVLDISTAIEAQFERKGIGVSQIGTLATERREAEATFQLIVSLLLIMAILLAIVGGLGLMGTMSINVLERTREIGVLRAIGAPNKGVAQVFIMEGVAIGCLSWLIGSILALPLGKLLSDGVGIPILGVPLSFTYSTAGMWLWLFVVILLSALASALPARNASRLTVREVLAYE